MGYKERKVCCLKQETIFSQKNLYAVLLKAPDPAFYYFSGIEFGQSEGSILILKKKEKPAILSSSLEKGNISSNKKVRGIQYDSKEDIKKKLSRELQGKRIGLNSNWISKRTIDSLKKIVKEKKWIGAEEEIGTVRSIKSDKEIRLISKAVGETEKILDKIPKILKKGMTEKELATELHCRALKAGAQGLSFPTIVASGKRGKTPHHITSDKKIEKGFLLVDFGIRMNNYCSDLSRTFYVGKASKKDKMLYQGVFETKTEAEKLMIGGTRCGEIFEKADTSLKQKTGHCLVHGLGHGLGIEVHDFPNGFLKDCKEIIMNNMVFTMEPAAYGRFGGIRIEDDLAIKNKKAKALSQAPRELVEISR